MSNGNGKLEQQWLLQRNSLRAARFVNFEGFSCFCFPTIILGNTCFIVIVAFRFSLFVFVFQGFLLVIDFFGQ